MQAGTACHTNYFRTSFIWTSTLETFLLCSCDFCVNRFSELVAFAEALTYIVWHYAMARRIKAEISAFQDYLKSLPSSTFSCTNNFVSACVLTILVGGWDVNEVPCQFSPPGGETQSITVSVPDDYPDIRPLAYTDGTFGGVLWFPV